MKPSIKQRVPHYSNTVNEIVAKSYGVFKEGERVFEHTVEGTKDQVDNILKELEERGLVVKPKGKKFIKFGGPIGKLGEGIRVYRVNFVKKYEQDTR